MNITSYIQLNECHLLKEDPFKISFTLNLALCETFYNKLGYIDITYHILYHKSNY